MFCSGVDIIVIFNVGIQELNNQMLIHQCLKGALESLSTAKVVQTLPKPHMKTPQIKFILKLSNLILMFSKSVIHRAHVRNIFSYNDEKS